MIAIELWIAFIAATAILLIIPGPTILTVISYTIAHGRRAKLPLILAVALGDSTALALSLVGLGTVLATSSSLFVLIKWAGGLYLIYLGFKLVRAGVATTAIPTRAALESLWQLVFNTWLVTALNPKGIVFFIAFLPQFIDPTRAVLPQLWVLSITFVLLATLNASIYAQFAGSARHLLNSPRAQKNFNLTGGSLLTLAGLWALTARQPG